MSGTSAGAVLAIDFGSKKTGFAYTDAMRILRAPLDACRLGGEDPELLTHIEAMLDDRDVDVFLVGLPFLPSGDEGERAHATRAFIDRLAERFPGRETVAYDERLTTKEAESRLREAGYHGADARARKDSWSALVLLEDWLESGEPR